jgi:LDH2 family malate/lactate/ureidoglycolate dehydrogenase
MKGEHPVTHDQVVVSAETLLELSVAVLVDAGLEAHAARLAADVLVRSSLRGVDTHGVNTLRLYAEHVRQGGASREAALQVVTDRGAHGHVARDRAGPPVRRLNGDGAQR